MRAYLRLILSRRMLLVLVMGFASGLPLALVGSGGTLQAWLTDEGVSLADVTFFALTGLPYTYKFVWAPFLDRYQPLALGLRKGWILICQLLLIAALIAMAHAQPASSLEYVAIVAVLIAFFSASQDIVVDAYRVEFLSETERGPGAALAVFGYRAAMLVSGGLALIMADHMSWKQVYLSMAGMVLLCSAFTVAAPEPVVERKARVSVFAMAYEAIGEFLRRRGAWQILAFVLLYKLGDVMAAAPTTRFMMDLGFSKSEIGAVAKTFGLAATIVGTLLGGALIPKLGQYKALWIFGVCQAVAILFFYLLALSGNTLSLMTVAVFMENMLNGLGTAAFTVFLMSLCHKQYTATQYALFTSVMSITRYVAGSLTGVIAQHAGWSAFFLICLAATLPGLSLLVYYRRWEMNESKSAK